MQSNQFGYTIDSFDSSIGGGFRLRLMEDGEEVGGGVFLLFEYMVEADYDLVIALDIAFSDAQQVALDWLRSRPLDDADYPSLF
jgi:hypothetical protein